MSEAERVEAVREVMQATGYLETPAPPAALRWIETFVAAYGDAFDRPGDAVPLIDALRAESARVPAAFLERLRTRQVLFFLDAVGQYVDHAPELRDLPLAHDVPAIAQSFGIAPDDALWAVRVALTGAESGPPLERILPLLGHDRILIRIGAVASHLLHGRGLEPIPYGPGGVPFETLPSTRPAE